MYKRQEIGDASEDTTDSGNMLTLFAVFIILTICSYVIYSGMENQDPDSELSDVDSDSSEKTNEDDYERELAIPDESSEEE